jgi:hypothetical protein
MTVTDEAAVNRNETEIRLDAMPCALCSSIISTASKQQSIYHGASSVPHICSSYSDATHDQHTHRETSTIKFVDMALCTDNTTKQNKILSLFQCLLFRVA